MTMCIAVCGVAPAVGKTTLAHGLDQWLAVREYRVDLIEEDELLTRAEFAPVARELAVTAHVRLETLLGSVGNILKAHADRDDAVVVSDALLPFVNVLLGWRYDEFAIGAFLDDLQGQLGGTTVVVLYVDADVPAALRLAAEREPEGWLGWWVETLEQRDDAGPLVHGMESAGHYLEWERAVTLRLLEQHGWRVLVLGGADLLSTDALLMHAQDALAPLLDPAPDPRRSGRADGG